jgi:hypothetical protein
MNAKEAINESITQPEEDLLWLLGTAACKRCVEFAESQRRYRLSDQEMLYRGARLLLILAALQNANEHVQQEQLCHLGTRGAAYEDSRAERRRKAARVREKPLWDKRHYVEKHVPRIERRIAGELEALVEHLEVLEEALLLNGETAVVKYL